MNFPSHSRYHSFSRTSPLDAVIAASTVMALLLVVCMALLICATAWLVASARGGRAAATNRNGRNKRAVRWGDVGDACLRETYCPDERRIGSMGYSSGVGFGVYSDHV
ncbi:hypothetical protein BBK36DRAFT_1155628 [Trichoderma citrinoviride]|uniref:Uncharacterized protein n=1 Tax=Trichoderma citrinoviride TaxID=58853 RepID=A0A2T4BNG8_9HYPO|nr:hypothetical protein BBK36DRAFT_1155628 [Trichoderma citrinoviride]PTB70842.1 hypothetical protein BBK36DRAFT_1155628 [Trichoderma citrinoviride]